MEKHPFMNSISMILVAMQLCIASPNMLILLKTTYNESQSSFPRRLLLYLLLEEQFATKRVKKVEFYNNADSNELVWATHDRWINHPFYSVTDLYD